MNAVGQLVTARIQTGDLRGAHRLFYIRSRLNIVLDAVEPTLVVMEDYAMSRGKVGKVFHIGELGGVLKTLFWEKGYELLLVPSTTMKSIIAQHGHAEKPKVIAALRERYGLHVAQHDEADAAGLMIVGEMKAGIRLEDSRGKKTTDRFQSVRSSATIPGRPQTVSL